MTDATQSAPWLYALARVFERSGAALYIVGGAVRNPLMGLQVSDIDVCGALKPDEVMALCEGTEVRAHMRAAHFGTVELHVADAYGRHMAEYTTFREDSYRCGHRPEAVRFTDDLAVDALRRDFSVNALYRRLTTDGLGTVIDPTGGLQALRRGELHTVTADPDKVLRDDGLRIMRAARFQAELALTPTDALYESLERHAPLLSDIAPERIRDELQKLLLADMRYPTLLRTAGGAQSGLHTLWRTGAWRYALGGLQYDEHAAHAVSALGHAAGISDIALRMAALGLSAGADEISRLMERLRFSRRDTREAAEIADIAARFMRGEAGVINCARAGRAALGAALAVLEAMESACGGRDAACGHETHTDDNGNAYANARGGGNPAATGHETHFVDIVGNGLDRSAPAACGQAIRPYTAAARLCRERIAELADRPVSLGALQINGDALLPLIKEAGLTGRELGGTLNELLRLAVLGEVPNRAEALTDKAREIIGTIKRKA